MRALYAGDCAQSDAEVIDLPIKDGRIFLNRDIDFERSAKKKPHPKRMRLQGYSGELKLLLKRAESNHEHEKRRNKADQNTYCTQRIGRERAGGLKLLGGRGPGNPSCGECNAESR